MVCIIVDPMLATGNSIRYTIDLLRQQGVSQIKVLSIIAAPEGIDNVLSCGDIELYLAAKDERLNDEVTSFPDWVMPVIDFSAQSELYVLGLLAGVGSFFLSWVLTPLSIKFAWKYGFLDYPSERKVHQDATPRVGGLAVVLAFTLGELLFWHAAPPLGYGVLITVVLFSLPCSSMINMTFLLG